MITVSFNKIFQITFSFFLGAVCGIFLILFLSKDSYKNIDNLQIEVSEKNSEQPSKKSIEPTEINLLSTKSFFGIVRNVTGNILEVEQTLSRFVEKEEGKVGEVYTLIVLPTTKLIFQRITNDTTKKEFSFVPQEGKIQEIKKDMFVYIESKGDIIFNRELNPDIIMYSEKNPLTR